MLARMKIKYTFRVNFLFIHDTMPLDLDQKLAFAYTGPKKPPRQAPGAGPPGSPGVPPPASAAECSGRLSHLDSNTTQQSKCETPGGGAAPCVWAHNSIFPNTCASLATQCRP